MNQLIKIEELFLFVLSIYLYSLLKFSWWWFPVLFFVPDIGMLGYIANKKIGAIIYNIVHHRAISILLYIFGGMFDYQLLQLIGIILFSHSTFDRIFGYGLKYFDDFKHTHLTEMD